MHHPEPVMEDRARRAWLKLMHMRNLSPQIRLSLLNSVTAAGPVTVDGPLLIQALSNSELIRRLPDPVALRALRSDINVENDLKWLDSPDHHLVTWADARYPGLLREISDPPLGLFVAGNPHAMEGPALAMVGSRRPTPGGLSIARSLAGDLCKAGLTIVSGLALGIDGQAHSSVVDGAGSTVAVMATGPDQIYPRRHLALAAEITSGGGAIITELPTGTQPRKANFPMRNRVISGLCLGVIVIEAARRSGTLVTARLAAEQDREVFAVPGSILSPLSHGSNDLIRRGAVLVRSAQDIILELEPRLREHLTVIKGGKPRAKPPAGEGDQALLQLLGFDPITADEVIRTSGLTAGQVSSMLLRLEIEGWLARGADGTVVRIR